MKEEIDWGKELLESGKFSNKFSKKYLIVEIFFDKLPKLLDI